MNFSNPHVRYWRTPEDDVTHAWERNIVNIGTLTFEQTASAMSWLTITDITLIVGNGIEH
jgi:hypothetical protein